MTMRDDDQDDADLRRAFSALRREEAKAAPTFEAVRARARSRRPHRLAPLGGLLVAASVAAAVLGIVVRRPDPPPPMASVEEWIAPTDFLLNTPGREILETVP